MEEKKYCYRCGTPYAAKCCPKCDSTIATRSPNSQTKKLEAMARESNNS